MQVERQREVACTRRVTKSTGLLTLDKQMTTNEQTQLWMLYRACRHTLGLWKAKKCRVEFYRWLAANNWPSICALCNGRVTRSQRSLDHIIPVSLSMLLELPGLIFDHRNFRLAHRWCNAQRSSNIDDLPESVRALLEQKLSALR